MADYSITAANVLASANAITGTGVAGATIDRTKPLIYQAADDTWKPAKADGAAPIYKATAWALNDAAAGQPIHYAKLDPRFKPGFSIAVHEIAILSWTTAGKLAPYTDIASLPTGAFLTIACVGIGGDYATLCLVNVNAAKP
jgi:hypothetical protein